MGVTKEIYGYDQEGTKHKLLPTRMACDILAISPYQLSTLIKSDRNPILAAAVQAPRGSGETSYFLEEDLMLVKKYTDLRKFLMEMRKELAKRTRRELVRIED